MRSTVVLYAEGSMGGKKVPVDQLKVGKEEESISRKKILRRSKWKKKRKKSGGGLRSRIMRSTGDSSNNS